MSEEIAHGCLCGGCDPACRFRPFKTCCGACMADSPHAQSEIVWPLPATLKQDGETDA